MKKIVFVFILSCFFNEFLFAQNFAPNSAVWYYSYDDFPTVGYLKISVIGDSVIENKVCKKLLPQSIGHNYFTNSDYNVNGEIQFIYSDSDKVYHYKNNQFYTLYNFGAQPGDFWYIIGSYNGVDSVAKVVVDNVGTIEINSDTLRVIYQHTDSGSVAIPSYEIIEKIGSTGFLFPVITYLTGPTFPGPLRCYSDSTFGQYHFPGTPVCTFITEISDLQNTNLDIVIFPNPVSANSELNIKGKDIKSADIITVQGSVIKQFNYLQNSGEASIIGIPQGIYFVKIVVANSVLVRKLIIQD